MLSFFSTFLPVGWRRGVPNKAYPNPCTRAVHTGITTTWSPCHDMLGIPSFLRALSVRPCTAILHK